jgi:hypothetical protein
MVLIAAVRVVDLRGGVSILGSEAVDVKLRSLSAGEAV